MDKAIFQAIEGAIKEIIEDIAPDVRFVPKYGGEVLAPYPDDDKKFVGGIFVYKDHVSLEFSQGASFDDPDGVLEGKGKNRRHLKFAVVEDVAGKDAIGFLKQALGIT
jgi:hypothetical protein|tara:strand:- start:20993 stop:21316 length:324 start_codon:yes stop_codon:yes gene_type:complete